MTNGMSSFSAIRWGRGDRDCRQRKCTFGGNSGQASEDSAGPGSANSSIHRRRFNSVCTGCGGSSIVSVAMGEL